MESTKSIEPRLKHSKRDAAPEWLEQLPKVAEEVYQITWKKKPLAHG